MTEPIDPNKAVDYLIEHSRQYAQAKADRVHLEHFRKSKKALLMNERNAHAQRKQCNRWGAGRAVDYRLGLIERIGIAAVEALESDNATRKWTREELRAIRDEYRQKLKQLTKGML